MSEAPMLRAPRVLHMNALASMPPDAIYVGRPTRWGNPYKVGRDGNRSEVIAKYLARLILPPPHVSSRLLVPFCGTGSEIAGALIAGWGHVVGIDNDPESIDTAQLRIPGLIARGTK